MKKILLCFLLLLNGCGTLSSIGHIGYEKIYLQIDQENALIKVNNAKTDISKGYFLFDKGVDGGFVSVSKTGYVNSNFYLKRNLNAGVIVLDAILIIPLIVDAITDEIYYIEPKNQNIFLSKEEK